MVHRPDSLSASAMQGCTHTWNATIAKIGECLSQLGGECAVAAFSVMAFSAAATQFLHEVTSTKTFFPKCSQSCSLE